MKKTKLGRSSSFSSPEAFLFILSSLLIAWFFGLLYMLFFLLVLLSVHTLIRWLNKHYYEQERQLAKVGQLAEARLALIRRLITFAYETETELFHKKFCQAISIKELLKAGVIDVDHDHLNKKIRDHIADEQMKKILTDRDIELCCLVLQGFSPSEITMVYSFKNIHSAYMKRHRLKGKLESIGLNDVL